MNAMTRIKNKRLFTKEDKTMKTKTHKTRVRIQTCARPSHLQSSHHHFFTTIIFKVELSTIKFSECNDLSVCKNVVKCHASLVMV